MCWRKRRHRRSDYILRIPISARETRISIALLVAVSVDSVARMVCFCLVDLISIDRRLGAEGRHQFRFILCAFGWRRRWLHRLARLAKRSSVAAGVSPAIEQPACLPLHEKRLSFLIRCLTSGPTKIVFPPVLHPQG